jgi:hypothetical protein
VLFSRHLREYAWDKVRLFAVHGHVTGRDAQRRVHDRFLVRRGISVLCISQGARGALRICSFYTISLAAVAIQEDNVGLETT